MSKSVFIENGQARRCHKVKTFPHHYTGVEHDWDILENGDGAIEKRDKKDYTMLQSRWLSKNIPDLIHERFVIEISVFDL